MVRKILLGIHHVNSIFDRLFAKIEEFSPNLIGLELPEDYLKHEPYICVPFFSPLAQNLKQTGTTVIPLESPELKRKIFPLELAMEMLEGRLAKDDVESYIRKLKFAGGGYSSPEQCYAPAFLLPLYTEGIEMLEKCPTLDDVQILYEECNKKRENYMLERIVETKPDMIIIGDSHANLMKESLPDYLYLQILSDSQ